MSARQIIEAAWGEDWKKPIPERLPDKPSSYSWLTPSGDFYRVRQSHGDEASWLLSVDRNQSAAKAFSLGWARIEADGDTLYANLPRKTLTGKQRTALIGLAEHLNKSRIILDNDLKTKVIWSTYDQL